jgi:hypothetical protein
MSNKVLSGDNSCQVWQYVFLDKYKRVETSSSKFITPKAAENHFKLLQKERKLTNCKLLGFQPVYQYIYN